MISISVMSLSFAQRIYRSSSAILQRTYVSMTTLFAGFSIFAFQVADENKSRMTECQFCKEQ